MLDLGREVPTLAYFQGWKRNLPNLGKNFLLLFQTSITLSLFVLIPLNDLNGVFLRLSLITQGFSHVVVGKNIILNFFFLIFMFGALQIFLSAPNSFERSNFSQALKKYSSAPKYSRESCYSGALQNFFSTQNPIFRALHQNSSALNTIENSKFFGSSGFFLAWFHPQCSHTT